MVIRYNRPIPPVIIKRYKKTTSSCKNSIKQSSEKLTPENRQFLQSLGFKVLQ